MRTLTLSTFSIALCLAACRQSTGELSLDGKPIGEVLRDLSSADDSRKGLALEALRRSGTNAFPTLVELLATKNESLQELRQSGGKRAPSVLPSLGDTLPATRKSYALGAFTALGTNAAAALPLLLPLLASPESAPVASMALVRLGPDGVAAVLQELASDQPRIRAAAAAALLALQPADAFAAPALMLALSSSNAFTQATVASALGKIGADAGNVVPALVQLLTHEKVEVRIGAITGLQDFGTAALPAVTALLKTARDKEEGIRFASAGALWRIAPDVARREGIENPMRGSGDGTSRSKSGK